MYWGVEGDGEGLYRGGRGGCWGGLMEECQWFSVACWKCWSDVRSRGRMEGFSLY